MCFTLESNYQEVRIMPAEDKRFLLIKHPEPAVRLVCAWCDLVLKEGEADSPVSHGICPLCAWLIRRDTPRIESLAPPST